MFLTHKLEVQEDALMKSISIINFPKDKASIRISREDFPDCETAYILLSKQELHEFIGVLLHVQSKMKGDQNG